MFSFFERKKYLVDYLHGLVDIHNHILPGIDDGAKNVEESIGLIKEFSQFGVTNFICTPHIMNHYYPNTPATIKSSFELLDKELSVQNMTDIRIDYAAEHMIDDNFENILKKNQVMLLNKRHILIEMSYLQASINFDESIKKITQKQLFPVLAHPERYTYLHRDISTYKKIKKQGVLFQLNMLSISKYYGKDIQKMALKLLDKNQYDFIASDVHNLRNLDTIKDITIDKNNLTKILALVDRTIMEYY